jgi:hypothetical protein
LSYYLIAKESGVGRMPSVGSQRTPVDVYVASEHLQGVPANIRDVKNERDGPSEESYLVVCHVNSQKVNSGAHTSHLELEPGRGVQAEDPVGFGV